MGWCGYCIYCGDDTQSCHYSFLEWAKIKYIDNDDYYSILTSKGTFLPKEHWKLFQKNVSKVLKKMPKARFWDEYSAIEWQMLLALYVDNKTKPPAKIRKMGIEATEYLLGEHSSEFDKPQNRRRVLRNFIKKVKEL
jgi:hypothetical protein